MDKKVIRSIILGVCGVILFILSLNIDSSIISGLVFMGAIALVLIAIVIMD